MQLTNIGAVVIGRNEGERLIQCLDSLIKCNVKVVYVDSGSTDQSVAEATERGVYIVNLNMDMPFTAARARNAGFDALLTQNPDLEFVQFVDGDCEIIDGWINFAVDFLQKNVDYAVACGRRLERYPERSVYNYQCHIEWNTPVGDAKACGGDFVCRAKVYKQLKGFNANLIAGEEPEFCVRVRQAGWLIRRLDKDMTWHDAAILRFKQWWKRNVRSGHAYAEGCHLHGGAPEYHWVQETRRAVLWGGLIPIISFFFSLYSIWILLLFLLLNLVQVLRLTRLFNHLEKPINYALLLQLSKYAEFVGVIIFWKNLLTKKQGRLIEYK